MPKWSCSIINLTKKLQAFSSITIHINLSSPLRDDFRFHFRHFSSLTLESDKWTSKLFRLISIISCLGRRLQAFRFHCALRWCNKIYPRPQQPVDPQSKFTQSLPCFFFTEMSITDRREKTPIFSSLCVNDSAHLCSQLILIEFPHSSTEPSLLGSGATGYPFVGNPEFPQTNGTVPGTVPSVPGTPTTPAISESWKTTTAGPPSLMKEPPIAVANRNATTQFATQGQQQAAVMMVYGLDNTTSNTDKLFNLVCLYGESIKQIWVLRKLTVGKVEQRTWWKMFNFRKCGANKVSENQRRNRNGADGWTRRCRTLCAALEQHSDWKQRKIANCVRMKVINSTYDIFNGFLLQIFEAKFSVGGNQSVQSSRSQSQLQGVHRLEK